MDEFQIYRMAKHFTQHEYLSNLYPCDFAGIDIRALNIKTKIILNSQNLCNSLPWANWNTLSCISQPHAETLRMQADLNLTLVSTSVMLCITIITTMTPYNYEPLRKDHIRLLTLLPALRSDPLQIRIEQLVFSTSNHPQYEALSYTWGDPASLIVIEVQSKLSPSAPSVNDAVHHKYSNSKAFISPRRSQRLTAGNNTFGLTENLYSALLHLRYEDETRIMWIDAICIDQINLEDKAEQV